MLENLAELTRQKEVIEALIDAEKSKLTAEMLNRGVKKLSDEHGTVHYFSEKADVISGWDADKLARFCKSKGFNVQRFKTTYVKRTKSYIRFSKK